MDLLYSGLEGLQGLQTMNEHWIHLIVQFVIYNILRFEKSLKQFTVVINGSWYSDFSIKKVMQNVAKQ